jgi:hypothetical protein
VRASGIGMKKDSEYVDGFPRLLSIYNVFGWKPWKRETARVR